MRKIASFKKYSGRIAVILTFCIVLALCIMIFRLSAQSKEKSSETSGEVVEVVVEITVPDFEEKTVVEQEEIIGKITHKVRKAAHFTEFCALGFSLMLFVNMLYFNASDSDFRLLFVRIKACPGRRDRVFCARFGWLFVLVSGLLYAASDEIHQIFSNRGPAFTDVLIDFSGVITGTGILILLWSVVLHISKRKRSKSSRK